MQRSRVEDVVLSPFFTGDTRMNAKVSVSNLVRRDPHREAVEDFQRIPPFPDGQQTWQGFVESCARTAHGQPFSVTLQKGPRLFHTGHYAPMSHPEHTFFGLLSVRNDGKLGKMCFGKESSEFVDHHSESRRAIFVVDGFDSKFLQVSSGCFLAGSMFKVTGFDQHPKSVMNRLVSFVNDIAGDRKTLPHSVEATVLAKTNRHLNTFLKECESFCPVDDVRIALQSVEERIHMRLRQMEDERAELLRRLRETTVERCILKRSFD